VKTIEVIVSPDGTAKVETHGFAGSDCQQASRFIERALGQRTEQIKKAEFYHQNASEEQQARQR